MPNQGQQKATPARRAEFIEHLRKIGPGVFCVNWPWSREHKNYVYIHVDGEKLRAHRWVYEQIYGPLERTHQRGATGLVVMHICDNRACVRPSHLRLGTQQDNIQDAVSKGRHVAGVGGDFRRKLADTDIETIRSLRAQEFTQTKIARAYGVSDATISLIIHARGHYRGRVD